MAIMDTFKSFIGIPEEDEQFDEEGVLEFDPPRPAEQEAEPSEPTAAPLGTAPVRTPNKVVNIAATTQLQVVLVKPERFEDASAIAEHLNARHTVVLNLESTSKDISRRLIDFLSGVAFANKGQIKRVANSTFIITPFNVNFMGDLLDELESNGVYY